MVMSAEAIAKRRKLLRICLLVVGLLAVAGFVAYDVWMVEQKTQKVLSVPGIVRGGDVAGEKASEGSETAEVPRDTLADYRVADDAPRALFIEKLGIAARIMPMGVNKDRSIQAPVNINDSGWYTGSAKPGEDGAMFIDGHASGASRLGLFGSLDTLRAGDRLEVERGDMTRLTYEVVHVEIVPVDGVDMQKALAPYKGIEKGLNLMTCAGVWIKDRETLDKRVIVYTKQA